MAATDISGTLDTEGVQGGTNTKAKDDPAQYLTGTISTLEPGAPTRHANPAYKVSPKDTPGTIVDTTRTDTPTTNGIAAVAPVANMTGTMDTVNFKVTLQTTTTNTPATPGSAPTVVATNRGVRVTIVALADPAGAAIRSYRVEAARVATAGANPGTDDPTDFTTFDAAGATSSAAAGVDWIERNQISVVMATLTPGDLYKFRFAGVNDNGVGDFSAWSASATPLNPDRALVDASGNALAGSNLDPANVLDPIYDPDGTQAFAVTGVTAVWSGAGPFTLTVNWVAPAASTGIPAATSYDVSVTGTAAPLAATGVAALTRAFAAAQTGGTLGSTPKNLVVKIKANPSGALNVSPVTAT